jgi:hypothetical protein
VICFRCGATVPDDARRCPSCEQDLAAGATLAAVPSAAARSRERGSVKGARPRPARDKSDITHQLSVEDIFEEFAAEEEEFLQGDKTPPEHGGDKEDTTSNFSVTKELEEAAEREDSSPLLGVARAEAAARVAEAEREIPPEPFSTPETVDEKLQSGPLPLGKPAARARELPRRELTPEPAAPPAARARELPRRELTPEPAAAARREPTPRPAPAPRPSGSRATVPRPSDPDPVTGPVVELSSPKPLPELAAALEPDPEPAPAPRVATAVRPLPRGGTAVTAPSRGAHNFVAVAVIGVALGLAVASVAVIVLLVRQEDQAEQVRRDRAIKRVQERLKEAERLKSQRTAPVAAAVGPDGCPAGMRRIGATAPYCIDMYEYPGGRTLPRSNVTWREAKTACQTRGARLCAEKEWEEACRGEGGVDYPYGARFEAVKCNVARGPGKPRDIHETGASAACKSAANVYDMSGNVAEWTGDGAYRGGSAESDAAAARCSAKVMPAADASNPYVGFRCCADPRGPNPRGAPATAPAAPTVKE